MRTFGYPPIETKGLFGKGKVDGVITHEDGRTLIQLDSRQITPGFSGAPVWDENTGMVIGMVTEIVNPDRYGRLEEVAFATPGKAIKPDFHEMHPKILWRILKKIWLWWQSFRYKTRIAISVVGLTLVIFTTMFLLFQRAPRSVCPCSGNTDTEVIICLIQAEAEAVLIGSNGGSEEGIAIIQDIFDENALIRDEASGEEWFDPVARYQTLFTNAHYISAENVEIQPAGPGITDDTAWFTSESWGEFIVNGNSVSYSQKPREGHWTFRRKDSSCWIITKFVFNASDVSFPP